MIRSQPNRRIISANDSNAGLKITQLAGGNALLVEDESSPDVTPFVVASNGNVGIGVDSPAAANNLQIGGGIRAAKQAVISASSFGNKSEIRLLRTGDNDTAVTDGDNLGGIYSWGHDGTQIKSSSSIASFVDGAVSTNIVPSRISFSTTNTAGTFAERFRIVNNGDVAINPTYKLFFDGVAATGDTYITESSANNLKLFAGGQERINCNATGVGFNGSTPVAKPTITGSRSANTVQILTDLLSFLHSRGDITNSTTA